MDADGSTVDGETKAYKRKKRSVNVLDIKSSARKKIDHFEESKLPTLDYLGIKPSIDLFEGDIRRIENLDSMEMNNNLNKSMVKCPPLSGVFCCNIDADVSGKDGEIQTYKRKKHSSDKDADCSLPISVNISGTEKLDVNGSTKYEKIKSYKRKKGSSNIPDSQSTVMRKNVDFEGDGAELPDIESKREKKNKGKSAVKSPSIVKFNGIDAGVFCCNIDADVSSKDGEIQTYKRMKHSSDKDADCSLPISVNISGIEKLDVNGSTKYVKIKSCERKKGSSNIADSQSSVMRKNVDFEGDCAELPNIESKREKKNTKKSAVKSPSVVKFNGIDNMDADGCMKVGKIRVDKRKKCSSPVDGLNSLEETENENTKTKERRKRDKSYHTEEGRPLKRLHTSPEKPFKKCIKKLLILDVNGILADIVSKVRKGYKADMRIGKKFVFKRPFSDGFIQFCFENFDLGVWSSRTKDNLDKAVRFLFGDSRSQLLLCWDQFYCTNTGFTTPENISKPVFLKELKKVWENNIAKLPWEKGFYNESNTLLLDDSPYKALLNPPHTAIFPPPYMYDDCKDDSLGPGGDLRVYLEGLAMSENVQKYIEKNPFGQSAMSETHKDWSFYQKVIAKRMV